MNARPSNWIFVFATLSLVGLIAVWPHIPFGYPHGNSWQYNVPWFEEFSRQLFAGKLYPRWLVDYPNGLGAPVFYFYAPAPFYLTALIGGVLCPGCHAAAALSFGHWAIFVLSGLAFFAWAASLTDRSVALVAAMAYTLLPYHYLDLEARNAIGEAMAYVWIPLILLGLRSIDASRGRSIVLTAAAYAGLIFSHLPSALLMAPIMAIFTVARADRRSLVPLIARLAAVGLLGVALAAIYMVPALMMQGYLQPDAWVAASGPHYFPENWLLFRGGDGGMPDFGRVVYSALLFSTLLAIIAILVLRALHGQLAMFSADHRAILVAAGVSLVVCWFMMTAPSAGLWVSLSPLREVQFPWRLGTIVDACSATVLAIALWQMSRLFSNGASARVRRWGWPAVVMALVLLPLAFSTAALMWYDHPLFMSQTSAESAVWFPIEYRPKWLVESEWYRAGYVNWAAKVAHLPDARVNGPATGDDTVTIDRIGPTTFEIAAAVPESVSIDLRRTYFPTWRLSDMQTGTDIPLRPAPESGLIRFNLDAGEHRLRLTVRPSRFEIVGAVVSMLALVVAVFVGVWDYAGLAWTRQRKEQQNLQSR